MESKEDNLSPEELWTLLDRERKNKKMFNHRLTISKVLDKKGLVVALKNIFTNLNVMDRVKIVDNLPFTEEGLLAEEDHIINTLKNCCEFSYEKIPFPGNINTSTPPWESPEYLDAKKWYNGLSKDDQYKVDILVRSNIPWG